MSSYRRNDSVGRLRDVHQLDGAMLVSYGMCEYSACLARGWHGCVDVLASSDGCQKKATEK